MELETASRNAEKAKPVKIATVSHEQDTEMDYCSSSNVQQVSVAQYNT